MKRMLVNLRNNIQQLLSKPGEQGDAGKQWCRSFGVFFLHLVLFISFCRKKNKNTAEAQIVIVNVFLFHLKHDDDDDPNDDDDD